MIHGFYKKLILLTTIILWCCGYVMSQTVVFNYTGSTQSYTVPSGVFSVVVDARGAKGGAGLYSRGGFGGRVQCTMAVTPGDVLYAFVGDSGIVTGGLSTLSSGGYNGGGSGANYGGGGGGSTDIRIGGIALSNRKLVAGGGAGGGYYSSSIDFDRGGSGGNIVAEHGYWNNTVTYGGGAGSPFAGGAGDTYSTPGTAGGFGFGGNSSTLTSGGGGGGGYFGGGGGSSSGGGGGSSYTDTSICTVITHTLGFDSTGQGFLKITPICTLPVAGTVLGPTSICNSQTATLSTSGGTSGGYWVSSNPAVATIGVGTGAITGNSVGIAVISYSVYNSCGSALATTTIEVLPTPVAIVGPASICTGIVSSMTEATAGGVWSSSSTSIASVSSSSGLVYGIAAGTVTISYTLLTGCNATKTILVNTSPAAITGLNNVCVNDGIVLANATPGGTWSTASTAASIGGTTGVVTGLSPGTAIITYSLGSGCKALQNTTVNPVPSAIAGSSAICNGTSTIYTVVTPGGVWSISATGVASISSVSGNVTGLTPGSAIVSYTLITGCTSIAPITINPNPLPIMGATSICTGTSTTLSEFTPGGTWRSSNPGIVSAGLTTGVITGLALGTSTITYTLSTGCYATIPETVYSSPASITGPARVCMGSSITLSDATSGGAWSSGATGTAIVNSTSGTVYGISPGSAIITYGITAGCMAMAVITVNPRPLTIAGPSSICQSSSVILTDPNAGGTWSSSNISMVTINSVSGTTSGILAGTAIITYTLPTGCSTTSLITVLPIPPAISGPSSVCTGATIGLSNSAPGGIWSTNGSFVRIDSLTGVVTGIAVGTSVISYTLSTGCKVTKNLFNIAPPAILPTGSLCQGSSTTLTASGVGTWSSNNVLIATIGSTTGLITGVSAGNVIITFTAVSGCIAQSTIAILPIPATYTLTGGGAYCNGDTGVVIGLNNSNFGVNYQLRLGSAAIGTPVSGNGSSLNFGTLLTPGIYSIKAINATNGCTAIMAGTTTVTINPLPTVYSLSSGGIYCAGGDGVAINLSYSDPGILYKLFSSDTLMALVTGTGSYLSFGMLTHTGTYNAVAINTMTGCIKNMTGSASVGTIPSPLPITGTTTLCSGGTIGLADGTTGGNWTSTNTAVASVGIHTGVLTGIAAGTATLRYTLSNGCFAQKVAIINQTPNIYTMLGGGTYCSGGSGVNISLSGSVAGCTYQIYNGTTSFGLSVSGTGSAIGFGSFTIPGAYTAVATNTVTGCTANMAGTSTVNINTLPLIYNVTGGGNTCAGSIGVHIGLDNTSTGVTYQLYSVGIGIAMVVGTGAAIDFGIFNTAGLYTVTATSISTGCIANMNGSATVVIIPNVTPSVTITSIPTGAICSGSNKTFNASPVNGGSAPAYQWRVNGSLVGATSTTFDYVPHTGDTVSITMTSNAYCALPGTVSTIVTPVVNPLPAPIIGSPSICIGNTTVLSTTSTGGTWNSQDPTVAIIGTMGVTHGEVTGLSAGTTLITYGFGTGCFTSIVMVVNPLPSITVSATDMGCGGLYSLSASGADTYNWTPVTGLVCTSCATTLVKPESSMRYMVEGTSVLHGCSDTAGVWVNGDRISGFINYGSGMLAIPDAKVWLIQFNSSDSSLSALDSTVTCLSGGMPYYEFVNKPAGNYMVKAKLINNTAVGSAGYMPTYSLSTPHWDSAASVNHNGDLDTLHVSMRYGVVPAGPGFIGGLISSGAGRGTSTDVPAAGMVVYLLNTSNQVLSYTYTDNNGRYAFKNIADGLYYIYPEEYNYRTIPSGLINLGVGNDSITTVNFKQHTTSKIISGETAVGVSMIGGSGSLQLFPNPTSGKLNIQWSEKIGEAIAITIVDMTGREVYQGVFNMNTNSGKVNINLANLEDGMYLLALDADYNLGKTQIQVMH